MISLLFPKLGLRFTLTTQRFTLSRQNQIHLNFFESYFGQGKIINPTKTDTSIFTRKFINLKLFTPIELHNHRIHTREVLCMREYLARNLTSDTCLRKQIQKGYIALKNNYLLLMRNTDLSKFNKRLLYKYLITNSHR